MTGTESVTNNHFTSLVLTTAAMTQVKMCYHSNFTYPQPRTPHQRQSWCYDRECIFRKRGHDEEPPQKKEANNLEGSVRTNVRVYLHTCLHATNQTYKHTYIHHDLPTYLRTYVHTDTEREREIIYIRTYIIRTHAHSAAFGNLFTETFTWPWLVIRSAGL